MSKSIGIFANLPADLEYLIEPALKYGIYQDNNERYEFLLQRATSEELDELARVAKRYRLNEHYDLVTDFLDEYPMHEHEASAKLYWLFGLMNDAGLPLSPENSRTVERRVNSLGRHGSFRLASERALAARFLAEFGDEARPALPALHRALQDENLRVQVWAHYALAVIEGNRPEHEQAVREIYSQHDRKDEWGYHVDDFGGDACAALEKFREI